MTGRNAFSNLTKDWDGGRKAKVAAQTDAMDEELDLAALREALGLSQADLARALNRSQGAVSQFEQRSDVTLSKLRQVIEVMGGKLTLLATFPERTVKLTIGGAPLAEKE